MTQKQLNEFIYMIYSCLLIMAFISVIEFSEKEDQKRQIENLIITSQDEEKAVTNKADGLMANTPYYLGKLHDEVTPMAIDDQFVMPVLKHGRKDKEDEYASPYQRKPPDTLR